MAVVSYTTAGGTLLPARQLHPPKEASERGWWNAARKVFMSTTKISLLPTWSNVRDTVRINVTQELIHYEWYGGDLFIARKRNLR